LVWKKQTIFFEKSLPPKCSTYIGRSRL
jgi:hypothetical protein